jgi:hypothetical protein
MLKAVFPFSRVSLTVAVCHRPGVKVNRGDGLVGGIDAADAAAHKSAADITQYQT